MSTPNETKADAAAQKPYPEFHAIIEVGDDKNRNPQFPPLKLVLRGRWGRDVLVGTTGRNELMSIPEIPGIYLEINTARRAARMFDPLTLPRYEKTLEELRDPYRRLIGSEGKPWDDVVRTALNDTDLKTWLYWMARLVQSFKARVVEGLLPSLPEIEPLPGKTRIELFNASSRGRKTREDAQAYYAREGYTR